ncbi:hypothetical protein EVAR_88465_1 [Eumeta japonica]|uniref:Uncharacterized protein n=1 Tax=Eumeta variegata TaxID=151549 RepID=A0A4C1XW15_EUMVA|nr:hypothetical protein EVAR_88465_1 [Eumeta japonica]
MIDNDNCVTKKTMTCKSGLCGPFTVGNPFRGPAADGALARYSNAVRVRTTIPTENTTHAPLIYLPINLSEDETIFSVRKNNAELIFLSPWYPALATFILASASQFDVRNATKAIPFGRKHDREGGAAGAHAAVTANPTRDPIAKKPPEAHFDIREAIGRAEEVKTSFLFVFFINGERCRNGARQPGRRACCVAMFVLQKHRRGQGCRPRAPRPAAGANNLT